MRIYSRIFQAALLLCFHTNLCAQSEVQIEVLNNSTHSYEFDYVKVNYPDNTLTIDKDVILPYEKFHIKGSTSNISDLSGYIYFKNTAMFRVVDRLQFKFGQPIFAMLFHNINSNVTWRKFNPISKPRLLSFVGARVLITDSQKQ